MCLSTLVLGYTVVKSEFKLKGTGHEVSCT